MSWAVAADIFCRKGLVLFIYDCCYVDGSSKVTVTVVCKLCFCGPLLLQSFDKYCVYKSYCILKQLLIQCCCKLHVTLSCVPAC